jgi:hypothetical protein
VSLGYATIITSINPKQVEQLRGHLRKVQPKFNPHNRVDIIKCQASLPLDEVKGLHLCSMVIVDAVESSDRPCLVFEATFDGSREEFFDDLLRVALPGIDEIYKHCSDYPVSRSAVPGLVKEFLISHDVRAQTFYSGSPGRSVAQIRGERDLRGKILQHVSQRRLEKDAPTTFLDLQRELQRQVIRKEPSYQWAEQPAVVPWEVTNRKRILVFVSLILLVLGYGLGALVVFLFPWIKLPLDWLLQWIKDQEGLPTFTTMLLMLSILGWAILRVVALSLEVENPRDTNFQWRFVTHVFYVLRKALIVFLVLLSLDPRLKLEFPLRESVLYISLLGAGAVLLGYLATSAKLAAQFKALSQKGEKIRRAMREVFSSSVVVCAVVAFLILKPHLPNVLTPIVSYFATKFSIEYKDIYTVFGDTFVGVLTFYFIAFFIAMLVRDIENADRRRYASATELVSKDVEPSSVYEREEGGVNKYQNHLASLTYVKPGLIRITLLRPTLYAIRLLARFWFNQGELGGIPTILAARWVLIDGGKRLLFLTNYGGGWDSYLDEFIDMGAVQGLNAIWTNTFIKSGNSKPGYAFPATSHYLWEGAQAELPFKAYVRHSQVETLVWYSAYPTLGIKNINANTELRQALFKSLPACELDSVFLRAGL